MLDRSFVRCSMRAYLGNTRPQHRHCSVKVRGLLPAKDRPWRAAMWGRWALPRACALRPCLPLLPK